VDCCGGSGEHTADVAVGPGECRFVNNFCRVVAKLSMQLASSRARR